MVILKDNEEESEAKVEVKRVDNTAVDFDEKYKGCMSKNVFL